MHITCKEMSYIRQHNEPISCKRKKNESRIKIMFSYEVTMWFGRYRLHFGGTCCLRLLSRRTHLPEDASRRLPRNIGNCLPNYMVSLPKDCADNTHNYQNLKISHTKQSFLFNPLKFYPSKIYYIFKTCWSKEFICAQSHLRFEC